MLGLRLHLSGGDSCTGSLGILQCVMVTVGIGPAMQRLHRGSNACRRSACAGGIGWGSHLRLGTASLLGMRVGM
jgi:hypothetical protein